MEFCIISTQGTGCNCPIIAFQLSECIKGLMSWISEGLLCFYMLIAQLLTTFS